MRRGSNEMQVNVAGLRRNLKNFAHNYSDAQKKVREATSNDPWGPSSTLMAEVADLTYNVVAFSEIMQMVWKRLNDHGRNWRHVYKALVLLEYLIKTGSEKVGQQCKENIFAIQTLKDFQHLEEGKDHGLNVREKAKQLVNLLKDDEKLKNERARALKAKERFAQSACGFGSEGGLDTPCSPKYPAFRGEWTSSASAGDIPREIEIARPQTVGEEELQLQLALAMSREEAEQEEQKRKSDDVRLQLALSQSQQDFKVPDEKAASHLLDLLDVNLGEAASNVDPWGLPQVQRQEETTWPKTALASPPPQSAPVSDDPWLPTVQKPPKSDPWNGIASISPPPAAIGSLSHLPAAPKSEKVDPWSPTSPTSSADLDEFDVITNRNRNSPTNHLHNTSPNQLNISNNTNNLLNNNSSNDPFELNLLDDALPTRTITPSTGATKKTPASFLGENSALVNLDNLVTTTTKPSNSSALPANPFADQISQQQRPVFNQPPPKPSINEMKQASFAFNEQQQQLPPIDAYFGSNNGHQVMPTNNQFSGTNGAFSTSNNLRSNSKSQDPWSPAPVATTNNVWMTSNEPANPFLS